MPELSRGRTETSRTLLGIVRRPLPFRVWFTVVAISSVACALAIGIVAAWYSWQQQKLRLGENLVATSRGLVQSTDRELEQAALALRAVSNSVNFRSGDLAKFERQASEILQSYGYFLIVSEPGSLTELINTASSTGNPLPSLPHDWASGSSPDGVDKVQPLSQTGDEWAVAVQMMAVTQAGSRYLLTLGVPVRRFQQLIDDQRLPSEWSPVILDQNWTIVARAPEQFIGQRGANYQLKDIPPPDSVYEARVLEGYATLHARSRSKRTGWTVAVAVPESSIASQFLGPAIIAGLAGFVISALAAGAIGLFSAWLGRDVDSLSQTAAALADHKDYSHLEFRITEFEKVAAELRRAAASVKSEETFRKRVVDELAHRLRNKLATVQAIVAYDLRGHPKLRDEIFRRLTALSATDDLIIAAQGRGAELADIIKTELAAYESSRVSADGARVFLEPKLALSMALVLHELATNASKYGAFASTRGKVLITWSIRDNRLHLQWRESRGPAVVKPDRHGFGSRLVTGILASIGGKIDAHFEPTGLVCDLSVDLADKTSNVLSLNADVSNRPGVEPSSIGPIAPTVTPTTNNAGGTAVN